MKRSSNSVIVHEVHLQQHRIVLVGEEQPSNAGQWFGLHEVAKHEQYFAVVGESVLPQGVFTAKVVNHQVLG